MKPQDGSESALAALGTQLRRLRMQRGLTLQNLAELTSCSWQHLGAVERGQVAPSENVIVACDSSLLANGELITMLAVVIREQAHVRHQNAAARRGTPTAVPGGGRDPEAKRRSQWGSPTHIWHPTS
ncbi:MAG: helix-turn-helix domain-containing protein [Pseudonocardiaceae bacterium]